jgi:hypothetical protein
MDGRVWKSDGTLIGMPCRLIVGLHRSVMLGPGEPLSFVVATVPPTHPLRRGCRLRRTQVVSESPGCGGFMVTSATAVVPVTRSTVSAWPILVTVIVIVTVSGSITVIATMNRRPIRYVTRDLPSVSGQCPEIS